MRFLGMVLLSLLTAVHPLTRVSSSCHGLGPFLRLPRWL